MGRNFELVTVERSRSPSLRTGQIYVNTKRSAAQQSAASANESVVIESFFLFWRSKLLGRSVLWAKDVVGRELLYSSGKIVAS